MRQLIRLVACVGDNGSTFWAFVACVAVSLGTWLGGAWVPGGLRPGSRCVSMLIHDVYSTYSSNMFHMFHMQKGLRPNSRICVQILTVPI